MFYALALDGKVSSTTKNIIRVSSHFRFQVLINKRNVYRITGTDSNLKV
jgi:hypothetical protein